MRTATSNCDSVANRYRRLADGQDSHARAQAGLKRGLPVTTRSISTTVPPPSRSAGRSWTPKPNDESTSGAGGTSAIVTVAVSGLAVTIVGQRDLGADIQTGGQVPECGWVGDIVVGELDDHVVRLEPDLLGRAARLDIEDKCAPVVGQLELASRRPSRSAQIERPDSRERPCPP